MTKNLGIYLTGNLSFLEDKPVIRSEKDELDSRQIVYNNVVLYHGGSDPTLFFKLKLIEDFFDENQFGINHDINRDMFPKFELSNDPMNRYNFNSEGIHIWFKIFKLSETFRLLGYLAPSSQNGMTGLKFYFIDGVFNR